MANEAYRVNRVKTLAGYPVILGSDLRVGDVLHNFGTHRILRFDPYPSANLVGLNPESTWFAICDDGSSQTIIGNVPHRVGVNYSKSP